MKIGQLKLIVDRFIPPYKIEMRDETTMAVGSDVDIEALRFDLEMTSYDRELLHAMKVSA